MPHDPTAWQVYATADIVLAVLAAGLVATALFGPRSWRVVGAAAALIALAFTLHALAAPPTNGANIFNPSLSVPDYASPGATAGPGRRLRSPGSLWRSSACCCRSPRTDARRRENRCAHS